MVQVSRDSDSRHLRWALHPPSPITTTSGDHSVRNLGLIQSLGTHAPPAHLCPPNRLAAGQLTHQAARTPGAALATSAPAVVGFITCPHCILLCSGNEGFHRCALTRLQEILGGGRNFHLPQQGYVASSKGPAFFSQGKTSEPHREQA